MLLPCDPPIGGTALIRDDPAIATVHDLLYVPTGRAKRDEGLFDRDGRLVQAAGYFRSHPERFAIGLEFNPLPHDRFAWAPDDVRYLFIGTLTGHYGHFLTASIARLWALDRIDRARTRLLVLNHGPLTVPFAIPWLRDLLSALGVAQRELIAFPGPTRFREIIVPAPSFEEGGFVHAAYGRMCGAAGRRLPPSSRPSDAPVFLTRMHLAGGTARIVNEAALCAHLADAGVEIVAPERLPIAEQVALFRDRPLLAGMAGSALHTAVFAPPRTVVALHPGPQRLSNQSLIDAATGGLTIALHPDGCERCAPEPGFDEGWRLTDPAATASALLSAMRG